MKYLIVNADDFGYSQVFNETILDLINRGLVTGTSVMVKWITENQTTQVRRLIELHNTKNVCVGLHIEFSGIAFRQEIEEQCRTFTELFGFEPEHIDIHKKAANFHDSYPVLVAFSKEREIPCKNLGTTPKTNWMTDDEEFRGTKHTIEETEVWLTTLKDGAFYHTTYHPGTFDPESKSSLNKEREADTQKIIQLSALLPKYGVTLSSSRDFAAFVRAKLKK